MRSKTRQANRGIYSNPDRARTRIFSNLYDIAKNGSLRKLTLRAGTIVPTLPLRLYGNHSISPLLVTIRTCSQQTFRPTAAPLQYLQTFSHHNLLAAMAPDLNSVPPSPRNPATTSATSQQTQTTTTSQSAHAPSSRRASQIYPMNPPPLPLASPGGAIPLSVQQSHQPFPPLSPVLTNISTSGSESGPSMPMRHPRPMTPAELHLELEKEQEAVVRRVPTPSARLHGLTYTQVNRLTRELTALRAHSASVASTASSTSTFDINGPAHPTSARRHRSSSSTSQPYGAAIPLTAATATIPHVHHSHRPSLSSAPIVGTAEAITSTPSAISRQSSVGAGPAVPLTPRYEDVALHRQELEEAKRENERLRRRVRELEALVRGRRASSVSSAGVSGSGRESRERSVSVQRRGASGTGTGTGSGTVAAAENGTGGGGATGRDILRDVLRDE